MATFLNGHGRLCQHANIVSKIEFSYVFVIVDIKIY